MGTLNKRQGIKEGNVFGGMFCSGLEHLPNSNFATWQEICRNLGTDRVSRHLDKLSFLDEASAAVYGLKHHIKGGVAFYFQRRAFQLTRRNVWAEHDPQK